MCTYRLPTICVVVATTRCQYPGGGYPRSHVWGSVGIHTHTHPTDIPIPQTYLLDMPSPTPRHTHPMNIPLGHIHSPPGHIPRHPLDISIPSPPGRDLGLGIPISLVNRHTPEKILPSRKYYLPATTVAGGKNLSSFHFFLPNLRVLKFFCWVYQFFQKWNKDLYQ